MRFVDSHLHLDGHSLAGAVSLALANESLLVTCGTDCGTSIGGLEGQRRNPGVIRAFVGVHPSEVFRQKQQGWVEAVVQEASGVGEIGLDPKYSSIRDGGAQSATFRKFLELAQGAGKPVQVHSRNAESRCLDTLTGFNLKAVLMHWFQDERALGLVSQKGYYVSFGPALLYSKKLQRMAGLASRDLVLAETDAPVPYSPLGGASGPSLVPSVIFKLAELWGTGFDETRAQTVTNACGFLGISGKG